MATTDQGLEKDEKVRSSSSVDIHSDPPPLHDPHAGLVDEKVRASSSVDIHSDPLDDPHAGLVFPTEEELHSLRRISDSIPWTAYRRFILYIFIFSFIHLLP